MTFFLPLPIKIVQVFSQNNFLSFPANYALIYQGTRHLELTILLEESDISTYVFCSILVVRGAVNPVKSSLESHHSKGVEGVIRQFSIIEHKRTLSRTGFW